MSEYQYYEFQAIDQALDDRAQRDLRNISSRATITATSFTNTCSWGDLRGDPAKMLTRWFDAFLHVTNWGTRWLAFRIPSGALSPEELAPYEVEIFSSQHDEDFTCLHFHLQPEDSGGDWLDGEELLGSLLPLREALGAGDHRCLYLAWLVDVHWGALDEDDEEPPVPPGLNELDAAHKAFVEFMGVDLDLLEIAAEASPPLTRTEPTHDTTRSWLAIADSDEKDSWLLQVIEGNGSLVRWELRKRLRDDVAEPAHVGPPPRTVGELMQRAEARAEERMKQMERARAERLRQQAAQREEAHQCHLDSLIGRESELWRQMDDLVATWETRCSALRMTHHRKQALIRRLNQMATPPSEPKRSR